MSKNYARRNLRRNKINSSWLLTLLIGLLCGYLAASVFDLTSLQNWINLKFHDKSILNAQVAQQTEAMPKPKFEFYTLLTHEQANAEETTKTEKLAIAQSQVPALAEKEINKEAYLIQVGSFKLPQEAERMKTALRLKGFVVNVSQTTQQNIVWYRVVIGPFSSKLEAQQAQLALSQQEHLNGMIRKLST